MKTQQYSLGTTHFATTKYINEKVTVIQEEINKSWNSLIPHVQNEADQINKKTVKKKKIPELNITTSKVKLTEFQSPRSKIREPIF